MKTSRLALSLVGWVFVFWLGGSVPGWGQLILPHDHPRPYHLPRPIPRPVEPEISYRITQLEVDTSIRDQVAQTRLAQTFENTREQQIQAVFVFPLPADGAVESLTLLVDGQELTGRILPAEEARRVYESYLRRYQDPALLEWMGRGMFQTSVFPIPPHAKRQVVISYSQVLKKNEQATDFLFPLALARYTELPLEKLRVRVAIESSEELKNIYSPSHNVEIQRDDSRHAVVRMEANHVVPSDDFRLIFDTHGGAVGAQLLSFWPNDDDQGYFVLLASPNFAQESRAVVQKTLTFVIDRSGSMSGEKIEQAREAAKFVVNQLHADDLFNIIVYDDHVETFRPELQRWSEETRSAALGFINGVNAGGSTNIDLALQTALQQMHAGAHAPYIVFLTDGLPTAGETNEMKIADQARQRNQARARIVCFGVGYDVNSRLLDRLARDHRGQSEYVRPDQNIEAAVSRLYQKIASPVLTDVAVEFQLPGVQAADGASVNRVYPSGPVDLFRGEQLVLVGRYRHAGAGKVVLRGVVDNQTQTFEFDVRLAGRDESPQNRFAAKLWASRRIGEIIDQIDLVGKNQELIDELVRLSQRHGILTPYTSYLADEHQDFRQLSRFRENTLSADRSLDALSATSGGQGFGQRAAKGSYKQTENLAQAAEAYNLALPSADSAGGGGLSGGAAPPASLSGLVQQQGTTVYRRGRTMIAANASDVDLEGSQDQVVTVQRFSDDYFALVRENTSEENQILATQLTDDELVVRLRGKIYRIQ